MSKNIERMGSYTTGSEEGGYTTYNFSRTVPPPPGLVASQVKEKFGDDLINYFYGGYSVIDLPGFTFTGELRNVGPDEWFYSTKNGPLKSGPMGAGMYLILNRVSSRPRIITYTLADVDTFDADDAKYLPTERGEMITADEFGSGEQFFYLREEQE